MAADAKLVAEILEPGDLIDDYGAYEDNYEKFSLTTARSFGSRTRNGVFGDARLATVAAGEDILDTAVERTAEFIRDFADRPPRSQGPMSSEAEDRAGS
jgi:creatinine amidohydrolase